MEIPIHEMAYMDLDAERLRISFRIIVSEPANVGNFRKWKYIFGGYWADEPSREMILDMFCTLFVMFYDNGFTEIVDHFLPAEARIKHDPC